MDLPVEDQNRSTTAFVAAARSGGLARPAQPPEAAERWRWVPIRSLAPRHRERILQHLTSLDEHDRYLRFGYIATDAQISKYVDLLDFDRDEVFGIFNRHLLLIAMAHLAHSLEGATGPRGAMSEFGVSVLARWRGRGFGARLFEHATLHARNRGVRSLFIHALTENAAMLRIARHAGATVESSGGEAEAWLRLPPDTLASHVEQVVGDQVAEIDYQLKVQAHRVTHLFETVSEAASQLTRPTQDDGK